jgi:hypothetical protein
MQDKLVSQSLFVKQHELLPVLEFLCRYRKQLSTRADDARQQPLRGRRTRIGTELVMQELDEVGATTRSEQPASLVLSKAEQVRDIPVIRVVEVRDPANGTWCVIEDLKEVDEVLAIALDLQPWMKSRTTRDAVNLDQLVVAFEPLRPRPLLQFDDDEGVFPGRAIDSREDHVGPLAGERQAVLHEHLHMTEARMEQIRGQDRKGPFPRPDF